MPLLWQTLQPQQQLSSCRQPKLAQPSEIEESGRPSAVRDLGLGVSSSECVSSTSGGAPSNRHAAWTPLRSSILDSSRSLLTSFVMLTIVSPPSVSAGHK